MQDLRLIGVHEDGQHLLLAGPDGERYRLTLDEALRAAARQDRPRLGQLQIEIDGGMRPRDVQAMIRSGATTEEVAHRAGWSVEKVRKYEGPILAERVHVADQARQVRVRGRSGQGGQGTQGGGQSGSTASTLSARVAARMRDRGVDTEAVAWDAWRSPDDGRWTVALVFAAGGRQRRATWAYDASLRTVDALDDEARWLSADEPVTGPLAPGTPRVTTVYDVEAEGGVAETAGEPRARRVPPGAREDEPVDLMTAMRQRTTVGRRSGHRRRPESERRAESPALPLTDLPEPNEPNLLEAEHADPSELGAEATPGMPDHEAAAPGEPAEPAEPAEMADAGTADDDAAVEPAGAGAAAEPAGAETPLFEPEDDGPPATELEDSSDHDESQQAPLPVGDDEAAPDEPDVPDLPVADEPVPEAKKPSRPPRTGAAKTSAARKGRTPVPSWDDIMFGAKRD